MLGSGDWGLACGGGGQEGEGGQLGWGSSTADYNGGERGWPSQVGVRGTAQLRAHSMRVSRSRQPRRAVSRTRCARAAQHGAAPSHRFASAEPRARLPIAAPARHRGVRAPQPSGGRCSLRCRRGRRLRHGLTATPPAPPEPSASRAPPRCGVARSHAPPEDRRRGRRRTASWRARRRRHRRQREARCASSTSRSPGCAAPQARRFHPPTWKCRR